MSTPRLDGPRKMARVTSETSVLMTVEQAAKWSGIPYTTLLQWVHEGILPVVQPPGKKRYWIRREALTAFITEWERKGGKQRDSTAPRAQDFFHDRQHSRPGAARILDGADRL